MSVPSDFPHVEVSVNKETADGYLFLNNWGGEPYSMILNNNGEPIWYWNTPNRYRCLQVQPNGYLTLFVRNGSDHGDCYYVMDSTYTVIDSLYAVDGYETDEHELQLLPDGGYLLIGRRQETVDMSRYVDGGQKNATVRETAIQEFTADGELVFQWAAWDHFDIRNVQDDPLTGGYIRFPHMNSIDIDADEHILLSSKRLSEVTKIDRYNGQMIWRLGGAHNEFEFVDDPMNGFSLQHDFRHIGDSHYTVFDNGVYHNPRHSRAIEYEIDENTMTARRVWMYPDDTSIYAFHMGNVQRLPNGNTFINWAVQDLPKAMEVTPAGEVVYEMDFIQEAKTYRAFRFPWNGNAAKPYLLAESNFRNITLIFNKFGDENVAYYNIYGGRQPGGAALLDTSKQTLKRLTDLESGAKYFFRVTAIDDQGRESPVSNEVSAVAQFMEPGKELCLNGNFENGKAEWDWLVRGDGNADWEIEDGVAHIKITDGGGNDHDIQLTQEPVSLIEGQEYIFAFDIYSDASRSVEAKVAMNGSPWTNYSETAQTQVQRRMRHVEYVFTQQAESDPAARIVFNLGFYDADVYIDNVSLRVAGSSVVDSEKPAPSFQLLQNYPNPFNNQTRVPFSLAQPAEVTLNVFDLRGRQVREYRQKYAAGLHAMAVNATGLASGVYIYRVSVEDETGIWKTSNRKMILVR